MGVFEILCGCEGESVLLIMGTCLLWIIMGMCYMAYSHVTRLIPM